MESTFGCWSPHAEEEERGRRLRVEDRCVEVASGKCMVRGRENIQLGAGVWKAEMKSGSEHGERMWAVECG